MLNVECLSFKISCLTVSRRQENSTFKINLLVTTHYSSFPNKNRFQSEPGYSWEKKHWNGKTRKQLRVLNIQWQTNWDRNYDCCKRNNCETEVENNICFILEPFLHCPISQCSNHTYQQVNTRQAWGVHQFGEISFKCKKIHPVINYTGQGWEYTCR